MELEDLKDSVSHLSTEELMTIIKDIRSNRRKAKVIKIKPAKQAKANPVSIDSLLDNISADQLEQLISKLEGLNK
jgi:hypothetical protein